MIINKKLMRLKRIKKKRGLKIDIKQLANVKEPFELLLQNKFNALTDDMPSIETMNTTIMESVKEVTEKTLEKGEDKNKEDIEIDNMEARRKELRRKDNKTNAEKIECTELNKTVKKKSKSEKKEKRICHADPRTEKRTKRDIQTRKQKEDIMDEK